MSGVCSLKLPAFSASMKRLKSRAKSPRSGSFSFTAGETTRGRGVGVLRSRYLDGDGARRERREHAGDARRQAAGLVLVRVVAADLEAADVRRHRELRDEVGERAEGNAAWGGEGDRGHFARIDDVDVEVEPDLLAAGERDDARGIAAVRVERDVQHAGAFEVLLLTGVDLAATDERDAVLEDLPRPRPQERRDRT